MADKANYNLGSSVMITPGGGTGYGTPSGWSPTAPTGGYNYSQNGVKYSGMPSAPKGVSYTGSPIQYGTTVRSFDTAGIDMGNYRLAAESIKPPTLGSTPGVGSKGKTSKLPNGLKESDLHWWTDKDGVRVGGIVLSGYDTKGNVGQTPWKNEAERVASINNFILSKGMQLNADGTLVSNNGRLSYDGTGGVFIDGWSNNPYYLQNQTGLSRAQWDAMGYADVPDQILGSESFKMGNSHLKLQNGSVASTQGRATAFSQGSTFDQSTGYKELSPEAWAALGWQGPLNEYGRPATTGFPGGDYLAGSFAAGSPMYPAYKAEVGDDHQTYYYDASGNAYDPFSPNAGKPPRPYQQLQDFLTQYNLPQPTYKAPDPSTYPSMNQMMANVESGAPIYSNASASPYAASASPQAATYNVAGYSIPAPTTSIQSYSMGSRGSDVKKVQEQLNSQGAGLKLDGIWGPKTEAAYQAYVNSGGNGMNTTTSTYGSYSSPQGYAAPPNLSVGYQMPSEAQLQAMANAEVNPQYDQALAALEQQYYQGLGDIESNVAARGMGRSSYLTDSQAALTKTSADQKSRTELARQQALAGLMAQRRMEAQQLGLQVDTQNNTYRQWAYEQQLKQQQAQWEQNLQMMQWNAQQAKKKSGGGGGSSKSKNSGTDVPLPTTTEGNWFARGIR